MAIDRIDCSFLASEFRSRTKSASPIATLEMHLLMNQRLEVGALWLAACTVPGRSAPRAGTGQRRLVNLFMFRSIARYVVYVGLLSVFVLASLANAQEGMPNPIAATNPLTTT